LQSFLAKIDYQINSNFTVINVYAWKGVSIDSHLINALVGQLQPSLLEDEEVGGVMTVEIMPLEIFLVFYIIS